MSLKINYKKVLADYNFVNKYAIRNQDGTSESWNESVDRIWDVYENHIGGMTNETMQCRQLEKDKIFLSSQRARQWADANGSIEKHNARLYNCAGTYVDRPEVFGQIMYVLLCGCGVGYNICKRHVDKLPTIKTPETKGTYYVEDTIEGWGNLVHHIMFSFFNGTDLGTIDYSKLRKKGDLIAGRFIHSGKEPLETAANKVIEFLHTKAGKKLKPIDVSDIICWFAQAVVSAGTRRSACIAIFSWDDKEMLHAKTGDWFSTNPQRAMANISALMVRSRVKQEDVDYVVEMSRQFGEPGLVFADNEDFVTNPCGEIGMNPRTIDGASGFQFCNLVEINMSKCYTEHEFYAACLAASTTATIQASFNKFPYLGNTTEQIMQGAALIGVSLTGYYDAGFKVTPEILQTGAWMVKQANFDMAFELGIMPARRCTTIKPSGNASILLETEPSINAAHSERYLRHVRLSKSQDLYKFIKQNYPRMIVTDNAPFSNGYDCVVGFPITTKPTTRIKKEETAMSQINTITEVFEHWILAGDRKLENTTHNVSNTIVVKDDEWEDVKKKIFSVRNKVGGVTFLSDSGDKTYPYCPYTSVVSDYSYEDMANIDRDNYNYYTEIFRDCINNGWEFLDMLVTLEDDVQARWKEFYYHDLFEMIENEYDNIDFSNIVINDKEEIGATAAVACHGGQCSIV